MTTAQAAWLRKLRDEGPQRWVGQLHQSAWEQCFDAGWADFQIGDDIDFITPAGLAAIDEHDRGTP